MNKTFLKHSDVNHGEDLSSATYFELRPVFDDHFTYSSYLYGDDTNYVQIRMGQNGCPSSLVATYRYENAGRACDDFFELVDIGVSLWYSGNDVRAQVENRVDMVRKILDQQFAADDEEVNELFNNTSLKEEDRILILATLAKSED